MILLVEDNEDDVFIMRRVMLKLPLTQRMHVVSDGREALAYLRGEGRYADRNVFPVPSFVLLDLKLPLVHGFEVLEWIKQQPGLKHVPVAVLSSSPEAKDRLRALELGAMTFLVKPPTPDILDAALKMALDHLGVLK